MNKVTFVSELSLGLQKIFEHIVSLIFNAECFHDLLQLSIYF